MGLFERLFEEHPRTEVFGRKVYSIIRDSNIGKRTKTRFVNQRPVICSNNTGLLSDFMRYLGERGIKKGDTVIVHSSMDGLSSLGCNAKEILDGLINLLGDDGTLVLPAFPSIKQTEVVNGKEVEIYNPQKTLCNTGMLPNLFIRYPDVVRSSCPYCSLAARGKLAKELFEQEKDSIFPQGRNSAWDLCTSEHAKVLFLGVSSFHSVTEGHIVEDLYPDLWPIKDWHIDKDYILEKKELRTIVRIKERDTKWSKYLTEYSNAKYRRENNLVEEKKWNGIQCGIIPDLFDFVNEARKAVEKGKIDYLIPKKFYK